jgi:hypothetical protein
MSKQDIVPPRKLPSAVFDSTRSDLFDKDDLDDEDEAGRLNESRPDLSIGHDQPEVAFTHGNDNVPPPSSGNTYPTETASPPYPCVGTNGYYHNDKIHPAAYSVAGVTTAVPESAVGPPEPIATLLTPNNHHVGGQYIHPAHTETKPAPQTATPQPTSTENVLWCGMKPWMVIARVVLLSVMLIVAGIVSIAKSGKDDKAPDDRGAIPISPTVRIPSTPPPVATTTTLAESSVPFPMAISVPTPVPTPSGGTLIAPGDTYCEAASTLARTNYAGFLQAEGCSCGVALVCGECVAGVGSGGVSCSDGCIYTSGLYSVQRSVSSTYYTVSGAATTSIKFGLSHAFTQGAQGSFFYTYDGVVTDDGLSVQAASGGTCTFTFNGVACGCQQYFCDETRTRYADTIDCSALQGGAVINLCHTPEITSSSSWLEVLYAIPTLCLG